MLNEKDSLIAGTEGRDLDRNVLAQKKKTNKKVLIGGFVGSLIVLAIVLILVLKKSPDTPDTPTNPLDYVEYNPFTLETQGFSENVWYMGGILKNAQYQQPSSEIKNYKRLLRESIDSKPTYRSVDPTQIPIGLNNQVKENIMFNLTLINNYQARVQLGAIGGNNYSVPNETCPRSVEEFEARFTQLGMQMSKQNEPFYFSLTNPFNGESVMTTKNRKFVVQEKYSEMGMVLPTSRLFGLGTSNRQFMLQTDSTYTLWSKGMQNDSMTEDIGLGGTHGSQVHPFILGQTADKKKNDWFGLFFVGGGAQSFEIISVPGSDQVILNYITLSDQIEFNIIMRGSAQEIIGRYNHDFGYPIMPSYWALGTFIGSQSQNWDTYLNVSNSVTNSISNGAPIEGLLLDTYQKGFNMPFTVETDFESLPNVWQWIRTNKMRMLLGIQTAMPANDTYYPHFAAARDKYQCLLQNSSSANPYAVGNFSAFGFNDSIAVGQVDVFSPGAVGFYNESLQMLRNLTGGWDGLYLRGNTPISMDSQSEALLRNSLRPQFLKDENGNNPENQGDYTGYLIGNNQQVVGFDNLPFSPGYANAGLLSNMTIALGLNHTGFANFENPHPNGVPHFYMHNLVGLAHHQIIHELLRYNQTERTNIFSESTWSGSGKFGGSWQQPLPLEWSSLKSTIAQAMNMGINGVNQFVAEVCGIETNNTLEGEDLELCIRWMELGAFMPMVRVTGPLVDYIFTDPEDRTFVDASRQRLPWTRYIYSQMYLANYTGSSMLYPLIFDNPDDAEAANNIEETFMLGDSLKISPVLNSNASVGNATTFKSYFPEGVWRDVYNYSNVINSTGKGQYFDLERKWGQTQVHLKPGKVAFTQQLGSQLEHETTKDYENKKMTLVINRDDSNYADGWVLIDDGETSSNFATDKFTLWKVRVGDTAINFWVEIGNFLYDVHEYGNSIIDQLEEIRILGAASLKDTDYACYMGRELQPKAMNFTYDPKFEVLTIKPDNTTANLTFRDIGFIKFGNSAVDPNVCDSKGFTYHGQEITDLKNNTFSAFELTPAIGGDVLETLYATALLMDDEGSINFNITTKSDWDSGFKKLFRVPYVQDQKLYDQAKVTHKLEDFMTFTTGPDVAFGYKMIEFQNPNSVLYQSDTSKLFLSQFLVFDSGIFNMNKLNDNPLMGMGERAGDLFFKNETGGIHSRWSHDAANPIDDGLPPGRNLYGVQPFYIFQSDKLSWFSVFNNNPYATDFIVTTNEGVDAQITTVTIGGLIEKYFFRGNKPDDVIIKYSKLTGFPQMQPMWAFGWQQCRFGWVTDQVWHWIVEQYEAFKIPLDTMWADIDYMDDYKIFTIAQESYANLPQYVKEIRAKNMTFVPIMDVGVPVRKNTGYNALDRGLEEGIFIKQALSDDPLTAGVWGNQAYFPDFFHPKAEAYWHEMWDTMLDTYGLEIDGIWIDMNEASTHCDGYMKPDERPKNSLRNKPYYIPGQRDLEHLSIGVDGRHYNGFTEYDAHNTFALLQVKATASYLESKGKRPFVLSRSNYPGLQKFGFHWIGDNWSWVEYMIASVKNVYEYQLFALPFMGSDLCGFNGNAAGDLCTRWHQLGTLFPFSRNHNQNATSPQEPFRFNYTFREGDNTTYTDLITIAIQNRYTFIRYFYSCFWDISEFGGTFFKPLFFEFPNDSTSYQDIERNILLGSALKASVETTRLSDGDTQFYFPPNGTWCQILPYVQANFSDGCLITTDQTQNNVTMRTWMEDYYVHQRNGSIIPLQNATAQNTMNTPQQLSQFTDLFILPNNQNFDVKTSYTKTTPAAAVGFVYFDDGVSVTKNVTRYDFLYSYDSVNPGNTTVIHISEVATGFKGMTLNEQMGSITIFNPFMDAAGQARNVSSVLAQTNTGVYDLTAAASFMDNDASNQILVINMIDGRVVTEVKNFRFDEVSTITIEFSN